jgi:hypothetical protein
VNKDCRESVVGRTANINVCRASVKKRKANKVITVRKCVPCALGKTHGKECLCRAPDKKRTVMFFTHGKARFSRSECWVVRWRDAVRTDVQIQSADVSVFSLFFFDFLLRVFSYFQYNRQQSSSMIGLNFLKDVSR